MLEVHVQAEELYVYPELLKHQLDVTGWCRQNLTSRQVATAAEGRPWSERSSMLTPPWRQRVVNVCRPSGDCSSVGGARKGGAARGQLRAEAWGANSQEVGLDEDGLLDRAKSARGVADLRHRLRYEPCKSLIERCEEASVSDDNVEAAKFASLSI